MPASSPAEVAPADCADPVEAVLDARRRGLALRLRTGGTTGTTRTVRRGTDSWWLSFPGYGALSGVASGARLWVPGPVSATMNLFALVHARVVGAERVQEPSSATHACLTPAQLDRRGDELAPGTRVMVAGASLPRRLHDQARAHGLEVACYYGASELSFVAAGPDAERLRAFPGVEIAVRDGALWARSPYLAEGVADDEGWASVGDRGSVRDGLVRVHGRPGAITTAGATIHLADVEAVLAPHAHGLLSVVGIPHSALGAVLVAVSTDERDRDVLPAIARDLLPSSHRPRRWHTLARLPLTGAGKVDRDALSAQVRAG